MSAGAFPSDLAQTIIGPSRPECVGSERAFGVATAAVSWESVSPRRLARAALIIERSTGHHPRREETEIEAEGSARLIDQCKAPFL